MSASAASLEEPRITPLGSSAILFEAPGAFDIQHQRRIWALADAAATWDMVVEAVPGMTNLMLILARPPRDIGVFETLLRDAWDIGDEKHVEPTVLELSIVYGGEGGPHLHDVAEGAGLSVAEVVRIHTEPDYTVYAVGSHAGYCYLGGLDARLFMPRRKVPLVSIPGGSLSLAGMQTGVSASAGPSGWHTIGRAEISFFDPKRLPPALMKPGDVVRFKAERVIA
ncbi:5-oxoprolinase subunit PxpB [Neorhizobium huautlense]|uniref:5-oxoprolinase subunit PxpB n=1 Tax=Neorhizobium huautlense TaxID=67774 RepID=UPI000CF870C9|nr:5-oxoprolinase subunit PxpB [Neorhizobium huautlense]